jgi:hypothetical protein
MVFRQRAFEPDAPPTARWLAGAAACLLIAALIAAGVIGFGDESPDGAVVSAAGGTPSTVGLPSTVTVPPPPSTAAPATPSSTLRTTTTRPRAASEVLRAIGTTAPPTTQPPAPTTSRPPATSTTPPTVPPSTTPSSLPQLATVRVANQYDRPFDVTVNGTVFTVAVGRTEGPKLVILQPTGDDVIRVSDAACTFEAKADHFQPGGSYTITVSPGSASGCADYPAPAILVTPA